MADKKVQFDRDELLKRLTPIQYAVTQEKSTERPYTGEYENTTDPGMYNCVVCGNPLFDSGAKFNAGCGWPSFFKTANKDAVDEHTDKSMFMERTEITCKKCGAHLGHVFNDGPAPTGLRYCLNSAALDLKKR